jgi:hypothetical protein
VREKTARFRASTTNSAPVGRTASRADRGGHRHWPDRRGHRAPEAVSRQLSHKGESYEFMGESPDLPKHRPGDERRGARDRRVV